MAIRLNGSANTGKKIMSNLSKFHFTFDYKEDNKLFFNWSFDNYQSGHICINLDDNGIINNSSLMSCNINQREFVRPLGLYNDSSLRNVFEHILTENSIFFKKQ